MNNPFAKPKNPFQKKMKQLRWKARFLKVKLFLMITLPIAIVTIGRAVLKEYVRVKVKKAAAEARADVFNEIKKQDTENRPQTASSNPDVS